MKPETVIAVLASISLACTLVGCGQSTGSGSCVAASLGTETSGSEVGIVDSSLGDGSSDSLAQSFTVNESSSATTVSLRLVKIGTIPDGNTVTVTIESDSSSAPNGTALASASIDTVSIGTTAAYYTFTLPSSVTLSPSTTYWIRATGSYASSSTDLIKWASHDGTGGYTDGNAAYHLTSGWATAALGSLRDFLFSVGCSG